MSVGLDCGASGIRSLRRSEQQLIGRQLPTFYTAVPLQEAQRRLLNQARISSCLCDDALVILGPEAASVAEGLQLPLIPLLPEGQLPEDDPIGRQVVARLIETVLPARSESARPVTAVLPRDAHAGDPVYEFITRLLRLQGYEPQIIPAALAVVLAELGADRFTGVGVSFGAAGVSIGLASCGQLVAHARVEPGGDQMDLVLSREFAHTRFDPSGQQYLDLAGATRWKQAPQRNIAHPRSPEEERLRSLYEKVLDALLEEFHRELTPAILRSFHRRRCPLVLHGGAAAIGGFAEMWASAWRKSDIGLTISECRPSDDSVWTTARGCMIHAELAAGESGLRRSA